MTDPTTPEGAARQYPLGGVQTAQQVANVMAWLLGDSAARLTGQVIAVDGGFTTVRPLVKWLGSRPAVCFTPPPPGLRVWQPSAPCSVEPAHRRCSADAVNQDGHEHDETCDRPQPLARSKFAVIDAVGDVIKRSDTANAEKCDETALPRRVPGSDE